MRKVFRNGNSLAVTIPKEYLEELNLKEGSEVVVTKKDQGLIIKPSKTSLAPEVDKRFMKMVDDFIIDHKDVLKELSTK